MHVCAVLVASEVATQEQRDADAIAAADHRLCPTSTGMGRRRLVQAFSAAAASSPLAPSRVHRASSFPSRACASGARARASPSGAEARAAAGPADVVLLSGGVESSALLQTLARSSPRPLQPLHLSYSQRAAAAEAAACAAQVAAAQAAAAPTADLVTLDLATAGAAVRDLTPRRRAHIPLPHRNLPLLALAVSVASALRAAAAAEADAAAAPALSTLYIALSAEDAAWYPSAGGGFLDAFRAVVRAVEPGLAVRAPFEGLTKAEVVAAGGRAGVVWADTYSCMLGGGGQVDADGRYSHCGRCSQCRARRAAFAAAGVPETAHGSYRR